MECNIYFFFHFWNHSSSNVQTRIYFKISSFLSLRFESTCDSRLVVLFPVGLKRREVKRSHRNSSMWKQSMNSGIIRVSDISRFLVGRWLYMYERFTKQRSNGTVEIFCIEKTGTIIFFILKKKLENIHFWINREILFFSKVEENSNSDSIRCGVPDFEIHIT